jgi:hypothetical protein
MKIIYASTICILIFLSSCSKRETKKTITEDNLEINFSAEEAPIKLLSLQAELNYFIDFNDDSLTISENKSISYWLEFLQLVVNVTFQL